MSSILKGLNEGRNYGRDSWDSNMPGYQGDYGGAANWGRRNREDDEHHEIDAVLAARHAQRQEYERNGKFWLKFKDSQRHLPAGPFIGKQAANTAAVELLKQQPELKGNLLITAYGPDETQGVAEGLGKNIKRSMAGWGAFDKDKPADVVKRVKGQDTDTLKGLSNRGSTGKGSPAELQQKAISRELKKRSEQGVAEGSNDTVYPNATVIKSKNGKPVGEIYQDSDGTWGAFHYRADRGADGMDSREDAVEELRFIHSETGRSRPDYTIKGVAEDQLDEISQDTARSYAQKATQSKKDLTNQTYRKDADTDKLNKKIQNRQQGLNRAHTDKRYYKDELGVAEGLSKRDQKDVDAIKAAIERLQAQLSHPNADKAAIQQSIEHEKKRLALYGQGVAEGTDGWIGNPAKWKEAVLQAHGPDVVFKNYSHPGQPGKRSVNAINAAGKQVGVYQRHNKMGMVQPNMQGVAEGSRVKTPSGMYRDQHTGVAYSKPTGQDGHDSYMTPAYMLDHYKKRLAQIAAGPYKRPKEVAQLQSRIAKLEKQGVAEAGNKPLEKSRFGTGDTRTPRDIKSQMQGASDEFVKSTAGKKTGPFHSKVAKMQGKMAKSELRRREQGVAEGQLDELSNKTLASYKKKAGADASQADKRGDYARGDKRMSGIIKATKKEFDNDAKGIEEENQRLDPSCWKGYKKQGTKMKGDTRVNNCVPVKKESAIMKGLVDEDRQGDK